MLSVNEPPSELEEMGAEDSAFPERQRSSRGFRKLARLGYSRCSSDDEVSSNGASGIDSVFRWLGFERGGPLRGLRVAARLPRHRESAETVLNSDELGSTCAPQLPQKCSPGDTRAPHALHSAIC